MVRSRSHFAFIATAHSACCWNLSTKSSQMHSVPSVTNQRCSQRGCLLDWHCMKSLLFNRNKHGPNLLITFRSCGFTSEFNYFFYHRVCEGS